jgi:hypothetical protein
LRNTALLTLALTATWSAIAVALAALGAPFLRRLAGAPSNWREALHAIWTGFALLLVFLSLWHLVLPVDGRALLVVAMAAAFCAWAEREWLLAIAARGIPIRAAAPGILLTLWIANHALGPAGMDDYNYEFQAIRWNHDYPIVPGLANLHARLAFNNAHHLLGALLSVGPWRGAVNHLINGFFVTITLMYLIQAAWRLAQGRERAHAAEIVAALLIGPCAGLVLFGIYGPMISTLKADVLVAAATAMAAVLAVRALDSTSAEDRGSVATLILVCTAMAMVKLTGAFFAAAIGVVAVGRGLRGPRRRAARAAGRGGGGGGGSSLVSGWILSGYPFYPLPLLARRFDWTVPEAQARAIRAFATSWSQLRPTYDPAAVHGWSWVGPWARETLQTDFFTLLLPVLLLIACLPWALRRPPQRTGVGPSATLAVIAAGTVLLWFVQAPAARFGFMYVWVAFACAFAHVVQSGASPRPPDRFIAPAAAVLCCVGLFVTAGVPVSKWILPATTAALAGAWVVAAATAVTRARWRRFAALCAVLAVAQPLQRAGAGIVKMRAREVRDMIAIAVPRLPERTRPPQTLDTRATESGLLVHVVEESRYETPLPNTRYFSRSLELRKPPDLAGGFRNRATGAPEYDLAIDLPRR